jgi:ABC-type Na+ efflux pump permease subunit
MYVVIVITLISVIVVPYSMTEEKETHTLDALLVSPAGIRHVVAGKALAGMVYGLSASGVVLAFNQAMVVHWYIAILAAICGTLFSVAVGLLMGTLFDNPQNLNLGMGAILMILMVPMLLVNFMGTNWPAIINVILPWIPSVALAHVIRISFSGSAPLAPILSNLGIVVGGALLILAIVVWRVRQLDR